ncbi:unnamed protein product [Cuscuta campestris]|uniref:DUF4283 domain-containing protein n=1 Tax=Cuscuta campestris TaxID=132261 RepID=A0A484N1V1_9ASTE|nr:unnamed protein product [Cuscuta campestris]
MPNSDGKFYPSLFKPWCKINTRQNDLAQRWETCPIDGNPAMIGLLHSKASLSILISSGVVQDLGVNELPRMAKGKKKERRPPPPTPPNKKELRNFLRDMEGESGAGGETVDCVENVDKIPVMTEEDFTPCSNTGDVTVEEDDDSESQTPSLDEERFEQELQKDKPGTSNGDTPVVKPVAIPEAPETVEPIGKESCENETGDNDGNAPGNKVDTPAEKKSFASLFEKNRSEDNGMKLHQVEMTEDEEVFIQPEDVTPMEELWGPCLVGCFTGRFPGLAPIQTLVESWKVPCQFLPHHKGWVVFKFLNNEDRDSVLHRDDHRINNKKLLLNIPQLVKDCLGLSKIASKLGRPLFTDGLTNKVASKLTVEKDPEDNLAYKKPNFCRVLIHMDLSKPPPSCVKVNFVGGSYSQVVEYEDLPLYCYHCEKFGHTPFDCAQLFEMKRKKEQEEQRDREKARVEVLKTTLRTDTRDKQDGKQGGKQGQDKNHGKQKEGLEHTVAQKAPVNPDEPSPSFTRKDDNDGFTLFRLNNDLLDAKATSMQFTWNRGSKWAKLDRVLVNCEWDLLHWDCWADFKPMEFQSDHCPVVLNLIHNTNLGPKPFKFFNMWMQHELFDSVVRQTWDTRITGTRQFRLCRKLKLLKHPLKQLNKKEFGHISTRAENARSSYTEMMTRLMTDPQNSALIEQAASLRKEATFYSDAERSFFLQKVKCTFINEGDKCTKFFHAMMKKQKVLSSIPFIITSQGSTTTSSEAIVEEFIGHYSNIFGNTVPTSPIDWNVFREGPLVPHHEIQNLIKPVDISEVKEALFSIGNEKSPGPDGYTAAFFKQKLDIVGNSLFEAVSEFFTSGRLLKQINHATVVLIPKGSDIWTWNPCKKDSHFFKKIAEIRDSLLQKCGDRFMIEDNLCDMGDIKATKVYDLLSWIIGIVSSAILRRKLPSTSSSFVRILLSFGEPSEIGFILHQPYPHLREPLNGLEDRDTVIVLSGKCGDWQSCALSTPSGEAEMDATLTMKDSTLILSFTKSKWGYIRRDDTLFEGKSLPCVVEEMLHSLKGDGHT